MNVLYTSLEALILKATHESLHCPDDAALEAFCVVMKDSVDGPQLAAQALALRIHSHNAREAILALSMLDRCMRRCNSSFHAEIGKFRFLNELIKLVSPKYFADRTALEVQTRVLQLLHAWSIEYPRETKFKVAYDMLKNQGVIKETPPPLPPEDLPSVTKTRPTNVIFADEEKSKILQKLLQSKKPEDLQHANRLIKTMVRDDERRSEANSRRTQDVSSILHSAGLLRDMLRHAKDASSDELQLICELHRACARLKPALHQLADSDLQSDHLEDILHANDVVDEVFATYEIFIADRREKDYSKVEQQKPNNNSLLDFAGVGECVPSKEPERTEKKNAIDELGDIFSSGEGPSQIAEPIKPMNTKTEDIDLLGESTDKTEGWNNLDSLGEQLLKESLPVNAKRMETFAGKSLKKIPMNSLEKVSPKHELPTKNGTILDLDFFTAEPEKKDEPSPAEHLSKALNNDDMMVDITVNPSTSLASKINDTIKPVDSLDSILELGLPLEKRSVEENNKSPLKEHNSNHSIVKPLADISVTLESVQPSKVPPLTAFEEGGVTVVLHFCKDKPRDDVYVIVVSTTSKNKMLIEDYKFQAVVPKGCKVRLLKPSATTLPPFNPFLPPPAVTQIMLVGRPGALPTGLKFVITYICDDESYSEMGEIKQLPLDDIY